MNCLSNYTLTGITADCNPNLAGIAEAYIGYFGDFTVSVDAVSAHNVTAITATTGATTGKFEHYTFAKQTGSLTSTLTKDEANGTRYYTTEVVLQFSKMEANKHLEFEALSAEQLVAIIKDNNGKYWFVGYDGYLSSADGTAQSGQSYDDMNGYNITLNAMSAYLPFEIQYDDFSSLID
jgi:hypothetical protein